MTGRVETCLNCDTPLEGVWCSVCGQANRRERLHANDLVHDAFDELIGIDTKIGRTLVDFTLRPGTAALAYVRGHRARYVNPLKYMIFTVALYFLFLAALDLKLTDLAPQQEPPQNANPMMLEVLAAYYEIVNEGMRTILFAAPPVFAWVGGFFLGRRRFRLGQDGGLWAWARDMVSAPRSHNFAESCSLWLHVFAHVILIVTLPAIAIVSLGHRSAIIWAIIPTMGYYTWAAKGFYGRGWFYSGFVVLFSYVCFQVLFMTVVGLCIGAAFWISA